MTPSPQHSSELLLLTLREWDLIEGIGDKEIILSNSRALSHRVYCDRFSQKKK